MPFSFSISSTASKNSLFIFFKTSKIIGFYPRCFFFINIKLCFFIKSNSYAFIIKGGKHALVITLSLKGLDKPYHNFFAHITLKVKIPCQLALNTGRLNLQIVALLNGVGFVKRTVYCAVQGNAVVNAH